jgi:hypothetical protein
LSYRRRLVHSPIVCSLLCALEFRVYALNFVFLVVLWHHSWVTASLYGTSRSHSDTPRSVGLLCTNDQPDAKTSTWIHTTITRGKRPCRWGDSNPQCQQASSRWPTP